MKDVIKSWLLKCAAVFPGYGEIDKAVLSLKAEAFNDAFMAEGLVESQVEAGFREWMATAERFPTPAGIIALVTPQLAYRMRGNEREYSLYAPDHPYVRLQVKLGQPLKAYEVYVTPAERRRLDVAAAGAPAMLPDYSMDLPQDDGPRSGGGLRRIGR